jgi:hypothetical protein
MNAEDRHAVPGDVRGVFGANDSFGDARDEAGSSSRVKLRTLVRARCIGRTVSAGPKVGSMNLAAVSFPGGSATFRQTQGN